MHTNFLFDFVWVNSWEVGLFLDLRRICRLSSLMMVLVWISIKSGLVYLFLEHFCLHLLFFVNFWIISIQPGIRYFCFHLTDGWWSTFFMCFCFIFWKLSAVFYFLIAVCVYCCWASSTNYRSCQLQYFLQFCWLSLHFNCFSWSIIASYSPICLILL